jgi:hypothetical protein
VVTHVAQICNLAIDGSLYLIEAVRVVCHLRAPLIEWSERTRDEELQACEVNPGPRGVERRGHIGRTPKKGIDL